MLKLQGSVGTPRWRPLQTIVKFYEKLTIVFGIFNGRQRGVPTIYDEVSFYIMSKSFKK